MGGKQYPKLNKSHTTESAFSWLTTLTSGSFSLLYIILTVLTCLCNHTFGHLPICLAPKLTHPPIHSSVRPSVCLPVCPSIHSPNNSSLYTPTPEINPPIHLFIHSLSPPSIQQHIHYPLKHHLIIN